jgi:hypothetical protein
VKKCKQRKFALYSHSGEDGPCAGTREVFNVHVTWTFFHRKFTWRVDIWVSPRLFLLENLEPIQLREKESFHQVRPDIPEVIGDPYGREISSTTNCISLEHHIDIFRLISMGIARSG